MKWEYLAAKLTNFDGDSVNLTKELNFMGQEGWGLVGFDLARNYFVFKRPKSTPDYQKDVEKINEN